MYSQPGNPFSGCIFRYRSVNECNLNALENNRLYFSTPENFNDPYDNLLYVNLEEICCNIWGNLCIGMDSYIEKISKTHSVEAFITHEFWNGTNQQLIVNEHLNNVCMCVDHIKKSIRHNVKIICFSEVYDSILMWSHYANNHQGYILVYDIDDLKSADRYASESLSINNKTRLEKVSYVTRQIDLTDDVENFVRYNMLETLGDIKPPPFSISQYTLRQAISQKSIEWRYEQEWRLIPRVIDLQNESPLTYISCMPKAVILGAQCNLKDSEQITSIARNIHLPIYRMSLNEYTPTYQLEILALDNI